MCNAHNHPPDCTCGWGGEGHRGISPGGFSTAAPTRTILNRMYQNDDLCRPTSCPICSAPVFFVRHNGGSVWFDDLGQPWPKHECFPDCSSGVRLRRMLRCSDCPFGVIAQTQATRRIGVWRLMLRCSDGTTVDQELEFNGDPSVLLGCLALAICDDRGSVCIRVLGTVERGRTQCWRVIDNWSDSVVEEYELEETTNMQSHLTLLNSRYPNRYYEEQRECGEYWFELHGVVLSNSTMAVPRNQAVGVLGQRMGSGTIGSSNEGRDFPRPSELDAIEWQRDRSFREDTFVARLMILSAMLVRVSHCEYVELVLEAGLLVIDRWDWNHWVASERLRSAFGRFLSCSYQAVSNSNDPELTSLRDVVFRRWLIASAFPRHSCSAEHDHYLPGEICWVTVLSLLRIGNLSVAIGRDYELLRKLLLWTGRDGIAGTLNLLVREFPSDLWSSASEEG